MEKNFARKDKISKYPTDNKNVLRIWFAHWNLRLTVLGIQEKKRILVDLSIEIQLVYGTGIKCQ